MYRTVLVEREIEDGRRVLRALQAAGIKFDAAFWYYVPEQSSWRLAISLAIVDKVGHLRAYDEVQRILARIHPPISISLNDIVVQSSQSVLVGTVRNATNPPGPNLRSGLKAYIG